MDSSSQTRPTAEASASSDRDSEPASSSRQTQSPIEETDSASATEDESPQSTSSPSAKAEPTTSPNDESSTLSPSTRTTPSPTRRQEPSDGADNGDEGSTTEPPSSTSQPTTVSDTNDPSTTLPSPATTSDTSTTAEPTISTTLDPSTSETSSTTLDTLTLSSATVSTTTSDQSSSTGTTVITTGTASTSSSDTGSSSIIDNTVSSTTLRTDPTSTSPTGYATSPPASVTQATQSSGYGVAEGAQTSDVLAGTRTAAAGLSSGAESGNEGVTGSSAGGIMGTAVSQIGNGIASTDGAIRIISAESSGIVPVAAGTETGTDGAAATGTSRNPFLNNGGSSGSQSGKLIGGIVGGIICAIVVVIAAIWLLGKRRRRKFVRPMVERIHTSGSAYSLPGMLSGGKTGWDGTGATGILGYGGHNRRRSRAFSIESASDYDPVEFADGSEHGSPGRGHNNAQSYFAVPGSGMPRSRSEQDGLRMAGEEETLVLPPGAAPYCPSSNQYGHISEKPPYVALHRNQPSDVTSKTHASSPSGQSVFYAQSSPGGHRAGGPSSASTHATSLHPPAMRDREGETLDPFDNDASPMPHSPTLQPTPRASGTLKRRTTDPFFGNKTSLRVVNPDAERASLASPTMAYLQPPEESARDYRYSVASEVSDFHYDSYPSSPVPVVLQSGGKGHRPDHLDLRNKASVHSLKQRGDSPSVYTPNEVNDVKFFRDDETI